MLIIVLSIDKFLVMNEPSPQLAAGRVHCKNLKKRRNTQVIPRNLWDRYKLKSALE